MHLIMSRNTDDKPIIINLTHITMFEEHQGKVRLWEAGHSYNLNEAWSQFMGRIGYLIQDVSK